jgi:nucleotide-binding universal stress UspA family protein
VAQTEVACGQTAEEVFSIIAQQQPDLLVIAAHRQSVVQRLFSGSVAAKVIRGAGIPTLLV